MHTGVALLFLGIFDIIWLSLMKRRYDLSIAAVSFSNSMGLVSTTTFTGGNIAPALDWFPLVVMCGIISNGKKGGLQAFFMTLVSILSLWAFEAFFNLDPYELPFAKGTDYFMHFRFVTILAFNIVCLAVVFHFYLSELRSSELAQKSEQKERRNSEEVNTILRNINHGIIPVSESLKIDSHYSKYVEQKFPQSSTILNSSSI